MYKMQVMSFIECATPAVYHTPVFFLSGLDSVQKHFLEEVGIDDEEALLNFSLAPLTARQDMAMLGVIHRAVLGFGPAQFSEIFRAEKAPHFPQSMRQPHLRHSRPT